MTGKEKAGWLADKICNGGDYAKEAAIVLVQQAEEIERLEDALKIASAAVGDLQRGIATLQKERDNWRGRFNTVQQAMQQALEGESVTPNAQTDCTDLGICPCCGGPADNGYDRGVPPSPYFCKRCTK